MLLQHFLPSTQSRECQGLFPGRSAHSQKDLEHMNRCIESESSFSFPSPDILLARSLSSVLPSPVTRTSSRMDHSSPSVLLAHQPSPHDHTSSSQQHESPTPPSWTTTRFGTAFSAAAPATGRHAVESVQQQQPGFVSPNDSKSGRSASSNQSFSPQELVSPSSASQSSGCHNSDLSSPPASPSATPLVQPGTIIDFDCVGVSIAIPVASPTSVTRDDASPKAAVTQRSLSKLVPWKLLSLCGFNKPQKTTETRDVLRGIVSTILPGRLLCVIGPSGAGKSTLLNVIGGRTPYTSGTLRFNGRIRSTTDMKRHCAYVQQKDQFLRELTVEEHLDTQISLRLGHLTKTERLALLDETIHRFGLVPCRKTKIGPDYDGESISGGERKRLNLASECLTNPPILLADEPTTGIDSFMAASVIATLKQIVELNRTVVATLHQPSSQLFNQFHEVMLLAEGRILYFGDRLGSLEWFARLGYPCPKLSNPADFLIRIVSLSEAPELRLHQLAQIHSWADRWATEGDAFLQEWTDGERFRFFQSSQSFAERSIEASLLLQVPTTTSHNNHDVSFPVIDTTTDELNRGEQLDAMNRNQQMSSSVISVRPKSPPRLMNTDELKLLSKNAVLNTFLNHSPRIARRELYRMNKFSRRRVIRRQQFQQKERSPTQREIDKRDSLTKHQYSVQHPKMRHQQKIRLSDDADSRNNGAARLPSHRHHFESRTRHPKSPPTFGIGSRIESVTTTTRTETSMTGMCSSEDALQRNASFEHSHPPPPYNKVFTWVEFVPPQPHHTSHSSHSSHSSNALVRMRSGGGCEYPYNATPSSSHGSSIDVVTSSSGNASECQPIRPPNSFWFEFRILLFRALISNSRDRIVLHARALQTVYIAAVYCSLFWRLGDSLEDAKSKLSAIFFVLTNQGLVGAVGVCNMFVNEKVPIYRELESRLFRVTPYILARMVSDLPVQTFFPLIFNSLCFWFMGFGTEWIQFLLSCLVALLVCNCAVSVGYLGSATAPNLEQALITAQLWVLPALLFGGYAVKLSDIPFPLSLLQYLSYFRYGYIAYSYLIFDGKNIDINHHPRHIRIPGVKFINDYVGFKMHGMQDFWTQILALAAMIVVFRVAIVLLVIPSSKRWRENR